MYHWLRLCSEMDESKTKMRGMWWSTRVRDGAHKKARFPLSFMQGRDETGKRKHNKAILDLETRVPRSLEGFDI